jgi:hypothetical protein
MAQAAKAAMDIFGHTQILPMVAEVAAAVMLPKEKLQVQAAQAVAVLALLGSILKELLAPMV